jgi:hypothetical protein
MLPETDAAGKCHHDPDDQRFCNKDLQPEPGRYDAKGRGGFIAFISGARGHSHRPADWSLTSLQLKLIKIGARVVRHAPAITFQLAEVVVTGPMVRAILAAIRRLRAPMLCA